MAEVIYVKYRNSGMTAATLGCVFAVIGIFIFAPIFFWLSIACTLIALVRAAAGANVSAIGVCILNVVLLVVVLYTSPFLWLQIAYFTADFK